MDEAGEEKNGRKECDKKKKKKEKKWPKPLSLAYGNGILDTGCETKTQ